MLRVGASLATFLIASSVALLGIGACSSVTELAVGSTPASDAGDDSPLLSASPDAFDSTTLIDRLEAKCAAPAGQADDYSNAGELSTRLRGRWYHCQSLGDWSLPRGTGIEFQISSVGTYSFLNYSDQTQQFTASADPDMSGQVLYLVFTGAPMPDAGSDGGFDGSTSAEAGTSSSGQMFIPVNDTTTYNGIYVLLTRADVSDFQFGMEFEQNSRKLHFKELGGGPASATFVPIDE